MEHKSKTKPQRIHEVHVRVTRRELARIRRSAEEHGLNLSNFFRLRVLARPDRPTISEAMPHTSPRREQVSG